MRDFFDKTIQCPHCASTISITVDASAGSQDYVEDCSACCNPMHISVIRNEQSNQVELTVDADDEQYF